MILNEKTLEKLRLIINEEFEYRSGPQLIQFFNNLGSRDTYQPGFPSRWKYTDDKLAGLNGTPDLDKCIKLIFNPINYVGRYELLDRLINEFNQFLAFDNWQVVRNNADISFKRAEKISIPQASKEVPAEDAFLNQEFKGISLEQINLEAKVIEVIQLRLDEIKACLDNNAPLSVIFLSGSSLEGILLGVASSFPKLFNQAKTAPKKEEKVRPFYEWTLSNLIDCANELGILKEDVKKFSHVLRDFRNYIHPFQQVSSGFHPDQHTAQICWQVLKAAIYQISQNISRLN